MIKYILLAFLFVPTVSSARVYDLSKESFATYFKGNLGYSGLGRNGFENSSGASTVFAETTPYNYDGEVGLFFAYKKIGFRLGGEILKPKKLETINGNNVAGTSMMTLSSDVLTVIYKAMLEYSFSVTPSHRVYIAGGAGLATTTLLNDYHFTPTGSATYSLADFVEEAGASNISYEGELGYEAFFSDNAAFMLDAGYRYLNVTGLTHKRAATTFVGAVTSGQKVLNANGSDRTLNLSGVWVGAGFRFYISL